MLYGNGETESGWQEGVGLLIYAPWDSVASFRVGEGIPRSPAPALGSLLTFMWEWPRGHEMDYLCLVQPPQISSLHHGSCFPTESIGSCLCLGLTSCMTLARSLNLSEPSFYYCLPHRVVGRISELIALKHLEQSWASIQWQCMHLKPRPYLAHTTCFEILHQFLLFICSATPY